MPFPQAEAGYSTGRTVTPRNVLLHQAKENPLVYTGEMNGSVAVDQGQSSGYTQFVRGGCFVARNSSTKLYAPVKRTRANALGSSSTALVVDDATHFKAGDSIIVGSNAAQAIVSVNSTTSITLTSAISWSDNDPVYVDAWKTAVGIMINDEVVCLDEEGRANDNASFQFVKKNATIRQDSMLGDVDAIWSDFESRNNLPGITFDDYETGVDTEPAAPYRTYFPVFGLPKRVMVQGTTRTVTAAESGTMFYATQACNFTLPTAAVGLQFGFASLSNNDVVITTASSADDIVADGDAGADTVTFGTSSHKIGSAAIVERTPDNLKWFCFNVGGTAATPA